MWQALTEIVIAAKNKTLNERDRDMSNSLQMRLKNKNTTNQSRESNANIQVLVRILLAQALLSSPLRQGAYGSPTSGFIDQRA